MLPLAEHPLRHRLNAELHSRPPIAIPGPTWISYLAVMHAGAAAADEQAHLAGLCAMLGVEFCPIVEGEHWMLEAGPLRLKWERHTEFSGYTFFCRRVAGDGPDSTALAAFPAGWVRGIPGEVIAASHIELCTAAQNQPEEVLEGIARAGESVVASRRMARWFPARGPVSCRGSRAGTRGAYAPATPAGSARYDATVHNHLHLRDESSGVVADVPEALARYEAARVGRARFVAERSALQVPRFHSPDPDGFRHDVPVDEALGLFAYDPSQVPV